MLNYKGLYNRKNNLPLFYEGGAHFKYVDLYEKLSKLQNAISPNESMKESPIENKTFNLRKINYKANDLININYKEDFLNKFITKNKNNNLFLIKKTNLKDDFNFNKTKSILNFKKINNIFNYNNTNRHNIINCKSSQNLKKDKKIEEKNNNYYSNEKNNNEKKIIKIKIKKLKNLRRFKKDISKNRIFKKTGFSLPKIDSFTFIKNRRESKLLHKNNMNELKYNI